MKKKLLRRRGRDDELHRAGAAVAHAARGLAGRRPDARAGGGVQQGRRRLLDHLLVAALQGALALAQVDHPAVGVGQDLHLDVARGGDVALDEQGVVAEGGRGLAAGGGDRLGGLLGALHHVHALAAAAGRRLDQRGVADRLDPGQQGGVVQPRLGQARHGGHPAPGHRCLGGDLVAHHRDRLGAGADEDQAGGLAGGGEGGVLGEEAVAGVHRVRAGGQRRGDDLGPVEVGGDRHRGVGQAHVAGAGVGGGVHHRRGDPQAAQRGHHPAGDLPAVGHQHAPRQGVVGARVGVGGAVGAQGADGHRSHIRKTP